jgi:predicted kinase
VVIRGLPTTLDRVLGRSVNRDQARALVREEAQEYVLRERTIETTMGQWRAARDGLRDETLRSRCPAPDVLER